MPSNVDHVADRNRAELVRLSRLYELPDFVKNASLDLVCSPRDPRVAAWADPPRKQFPCDSAASTWLSALFYQEKKAEFHPKDRVRIERRLEGQASYWRIKTACDKIVARWMELHKTAEDQLPDCMFASVWVGEDGRKERHLRLSNAMEVKAAAEYLHQYRDRFPFADRHAMAKRIIDKAHSYGASFGKFAEFMEQQAGRGVCDPKEVIAFVRDRARMVPDTVVKEAADGKPVTLRGMFLDMAAEIETAPRRYLDPGNLIKLATTLDMLDRCHNLVGRYAQGLTRPEDVVFKTTFYKVAAEMHQVMATTTGNVYEKTAFRRLKLADVAGLLGSGFAERITTALGEIDAEKFAEEAATLPRPDAELLDGLMAEARVSPVLQKAASSRRGLSPEEMAAWAQAYETVR